MGAHRHGKLDLAALDVKAIIEHLRNGLAAKALAAKLEGQIEINEIYVVAVHKGQPGEVVKWASRDDAADDRARRAEAR